MPFFQCTYVPCISEKSEELRILKDGTYEYKGTFVQLKILRKGARAIGIQMKIGGNVVFFRVNAGEAMPYLVRYFKAF